MKRTKYLLICLVLAISMIMVCACGDESSQKEQQAKGHLRLERVDWADDVKTAIND